MLLFRQLVVQFIILSNLLQPFQNASTPPSDGLMHQSWMYDAQFFTVSFKGAICTEQMQPLHAVTISHQCTRVLNLAISSIIKGAGFDFQVFCRQSSTEAGQPDLVVKQLARCFPSPLGRAGPGLNSAAWGRLLATGLQGAALRLNTEW